MEWFWEFLLVNLRTQRSTCFALFLYFSVSLCSAFARKVLLMKKLWFTLLLPFMLTSDVLAQTRKPVKKQLPRKEGKLPPVYLGKTPLVFGDRKEYLCTMRKVFRAQIYGRRVKDNVYGYRSSFSRIWKYKKIFSPNIFLPVHGVLVVGLYDKWISLPKGKEKRKTLLLLKYAYLRLQLLSWQTCKGLYQKRKASPPRTRGKVVI